MMWETPIADEMDIQYARKVSALEGVRALWGRIYVPEDVQTVWDRTSVSEYRYSVVDADMLDTARFLKGTPTVGTSTYADRIRDEVVREDAETKQILAEIQDLEVANPSDLDLCPRCVPLVKLRAANLCDAEANAIFITPKGRVFGTDEPVPRLANEQAGAVQDLENVGRFRLASTVSEIIRESEDDPTEPGVVMKSLKAMVGFLTEYGDFDNPVVGPNPDGIMQIEWHIEGRGLLVVIFKGGDTVQCIALADETPDRPAMNLSKRMSIREFVEEFGELVPTRKA